MADPLTSRWYTPPGVHCEHNVDSGAKYPRLRAEFHGAFGENNSDKEKQRPWPWFKFRRDVEAAIPIDDCVTKQKLILLSCIV